MTVSVTVIGCEHRSGPHSGHATHLLRFAVQVDHGGGQTLLREQPGLLTPPRTAAIDGQAVTPPQVDTSDRPWPVFRDENNTWL
ncbi:hypothetical protein ACWEQW_33035 [Streptomyces nigra]